MIKLVVCDIDGTISDHTPRMHLAASGDWDSYHEAMADDKPNGAVVDFLRMLGPQCHLVFLTGRPDEYRPQTSKWLDDQFIFAFDDYDALIMREKGDFGSDVDLKPEALSKWLDESGEDIKPREVLILEDRDKMVARWRDLGYNCWQVNEGAF